MTRSFNYYNPVQIDFSEGSVQRLPHYLKGRKALLVTSQSFTSRGVVEDIQRRNTTIIDVYDQVKPNPTLNEVALFFESFSMESFEVIIALGGGSVLDFAKAISLSSSGNYSYQIFHRVLLGEEVKEIESLPIIGIPTTAGTSSELTPWGTIWDDVNKVKHSIYTEELWCEVAIYDPKLTYSLPRDITIQTGLDALSHSLESIWNRNRNPISDKHAIEAIHIIIRDLPLLAEDLNNPCLRSNLMYASMRAGLAFSNTQTAIAHAMSYYLTLHHKIPHGIAASITLPTIASAALFHKEVSAILKEVLGENPAAALKGVFRQLDVSIDLGTYGLDHSAMEAMRDSLEGTDRTKNSLISVDSVFKRLLKQFNV